MTREDLKYKLGKIGKRCFVNCFEKAWEEWESSVVFTTEDILIADPEINEEARERTGKDVTEISLSSRCFKISSIFQDSRHIEALQICINAKKIDPAAREKAKMLHDRYSR